MKGEPLNLNHQSLIKPLLESLCESLKVPCSEYNFSNAYLFRHQHQHKLLQKKALYITGKYYNEEPYIIPTIPVKECLHEIIEILQETKASLFPIPDEWLSYFPEDKFLRFFDQGDSDYIYDANLFRTLAGRHLSKRRNQIYQLERKYNKLECKTITQSELHDTIHVLDEWQKQSDQPKNKTDYDSCINGLLEKDSLGLIGYILYGDNSPLGWYLGSKLSSKTALLILEKQLPNINGITPYLYHDFALQAQEQIQWINLEQDLNLDSLRKAKHSYHPNLMGKKWRIKIK